MGKVVKNSIKAPKKKAGSSLELNVKEMPKLPIPNRLADQELGGPRLPYIRDTFWIIRCSKVDNKKLRNLEIARCHHPFKKADGRCKHSSC